MGKEYGKATLDQIKQTLSLVPELSKIGKELPKLFKDDGDFFKKAPLDFAWSDFYILPFQEVLSIFYVVGGLADDAHEMANSSDPKQFVFDELLKREPTIQDFGLGKEYSEYVYVGVFVAMVRSLQSIEIHGCSLNRLMEYARLGSDKALFEAIKIDRSIATCELAAKRCAIAELKKDNQFFNKLKNALDGNPKKHDRAHNDLRFVLAMLNEFDMLKELTPKKLFNLCHAELSLYRDDEKSFNTFVRRWKKQHAASNENLM